MKDCAYYQELISRLVDREITPEEGEELAENVMAEIRRAELWKQNRRPRRQMRRWAALAASAVLVIGVGALTLPRLLGAKGAAKAANSEAVYSAEEPMMAAPAAGAAAYDSAAVSEEAAEMAPIPVSDDFAAPASETTKSEQEMIHEAIARSEEPETVADIVDVTGQGRGRNIAALLVGTPGELPSGVTPDHRFLLRFDIDGVSSQVLISVYGEKVFYISLSGEESDMMLSDYGWSSLRAKIYN